MDAIQLRFNIDSVKVFFSILSTFLLTCVAWVFFRAKTISDAVSYLKRIITDGDFKIQFLANDRSNYELILIIVVFTLIEWNNRNKIEPISGKGSTIKLAFAIAAIMALGTFSDYKEFIYFQF